MGIKKTSTVSVLIQSSIQQRIDFIFWGMNSDRIRKIRLPRKKKKVLKKSITKKFIKSLVKPIDLTVGLRVEDSVGIKGKVIECSDIHNVLVEYDMGGSGLYCISEKCCDMKAKEYDPLYHITCK